jgi:hypothetical protein
MQDDVSPFDRTTNFLMDQSGNEVMGGPDPVARSMIIVDNRAVYQILEPRYRSRLPPGPLGGDPLPTRPAIVTLWHKSHVDQKWTVLVVDEMLDQPTGPSSIPLSKSSAM